MRLIDSQNLTRMDGAVAGRATRHSVPVGVREQYADPALTGLEADKSSRMHSLLTFQKTVT
jgi:hypothetical protein